MKKGYLYLLLAAFSYASMGALIKVLSVDFGPFWQTFLRLVVSALITATIVRLSKKPFTLKHRADYWLMLFMGVIGYGVQIMLFTLSIYHNTIGNSLFVFSSYPILAALLAFVFLKEKLLRRVVVAMIILACSLFLLFNPDHFGVHLLGNIYALLAGFTFATYIICSRVLSRRGNAPETTTLWSVSIAAITSGIAAVALEPAAFSFSPMAIFYLVLFGLLNAAAFNLVNKGFATVEVGIGTMILLAEPVIGSLLGLCLFGEIPTLTFILGAVIMLTAIYIATFKPD
jgi:drug/metabolite transporter (DMT)-like permease